ncbi:MAG: Uma2 family endonuclease [Desulfamplus sp.]
MLLNKKYKITPQEYLIAERLSESKNEYFNGEIFAMAGASMEHNQISSNIVRVLGNQLVESQCTVLANDMKIKIEAIEKYTYPDIVVVCGNGEFEQDKENSDDKAINDEYERKNDILLNPIVIMEILSASTEGYDRGDKFSHYQFIDSFIEYLLISQYVCRVEKFIRQKDKTWIYSTYSNLEDTVKIESINCDLPVAEIYRKVNLKPFVLRQVKNI